MPKAEKRQRKKAQRRQRVEAEIRRHKARQRRQLIVLIGILVLAVAAVSALSLRANKGKKAASPGSSPSASPSPSPSASPSPGAIACAGSVPQKGNSSPVSEPPPMAVDKAKAYTATIETSCGTIVVDLADDTSPNTVNSFVFLARRGFFDGLTFHRVVKGFAVQGGDPKGAGTGGPGYKVTEAPPSDLKYVNGTVAMAKAGNEPPGTSGSQFFIVPGDGAADLPAEYALLGRVKSGQDVVDRIQSLPVAAEKPQETVYIVNITIAES